MQSCLACAFLQTKYPFPDDAISRLYADYRSNAYNAERSYYEPGYAEVASAVGEHSEEGKTRVEALTAWLAPKLHGTTPSMLDFGGADGKYLPNLPARKFVYEISNIEPVSGVTRIPSQDMLASYGYVQLAHVLEHVTHPLDLACEVAALVEPNGLFLIEVPQDLELERIGKLQCGEDDGSIQIHEHINVYSRQAVEQLFKAIGFQIVALDAIPVVSPVAKQFFIRGLGRKPANWSSPAST